MPTAEIGDPCSLQCAFSPTDLVFEEKASIDEAFIDFTRPVREEILKRYPYLAEVPPDAPQGKDSPLPPPPPISWDALGTLIPVNPRPPPPPPPESSDTQDEPSRPDESAGEPSVVPESSTPAPEETIPEATNESISDEDENSRTWHDVALSIAAELMDTTRREVHTKFGYTMTAVCLASCFDRI